MLLTGNRPSRAVQRTVPKGFRVTAARASLAVRDGVAQGVYAQDRGHGFPELAAGERVGLPSGFNPAEGAALFRPCSLFHVSPHWLPLLTQRAVDEKCKT